MAALPAGVQHGLSSESCCEDNMTTTTYAAAWDRMVRYVAAQQSTRLIRKPNQAGVRYREALRAAHIAASFAPGPRASPSPGKRPSSADEPASLPAGGAPGTARGAAAASTVSLLPDDDEDDEPAPKKRCISRCRRPSSTSSSGYATTSSGERQAEDIEDGRVPDESFDYLASIERSSWIQAQYPPIASKEIRRRYKDEFGKLYPEYRKLHERLRLVADRFTRLEVEYRSAHPLSVEDVKQRIEDEYVRVKHQTSYDQEKRCFSHLHSKLAHIKLRVAEYDSNR